jgi:hypothetical protein
MNRAAELLAWVNNNAALSIRKCGGEWCVWYSWAPNPDARCLGHHKDLIQALEIAKQNSEAAL